MELFIIKHVTGRTLHLKGEKVTFTNKQDAKAVRGLFNEDLNSPEWHISRGKDNLKSSKPHGRPRGTRMKFYR